LPWLRTCRTLHGGPEDNRAWLMLGAAKALERKEHIAGVDVDLAPVRSS
jgi:hypothetical protein